MAELFGFKITRSKNEKATSQDFTLPSVDDGSQTVIGGGGHIGHYLDIEGKIKDEADLIRRYREVAIQPECDQAIEDIVNEAIVSDEIEPPVRINLDRVKTFSLDLKKKIQNEFDEVLRLLEFEEKGHDIFRRWYVDGRMFYHKVIDPTKPKNGIKELRYIDPRKIKKIREIKKKDGKMKMPGDAPDPMEYKEYYVYNEKGVGGSMNTGGIRIHPDAISFCPSGLVDQQKNVILSHLHKAIKPVNQLRMIEDSLVIYRISRAPERRIFKIDVGNLPKIKAEQYLKDVMNRYRNKLVYDASTGEIRDDRNYMSMLEDFWLPTREGGRGTDITTLPGGSNLGEIEDIRYFQKKLYQALNVPYSRMDSEAQGGLQLGKATEVSRDEIKFTKYIGRLRKKFIHLFSDTLKTQVILKGIVSEDDWNNISDFIKYDFMQDGYFSEMKEQEIRGSRLQQAQDLFQNQMVGKVFSMDYVLKNVLRMTDLEIERQREQIKQEIDQGIIKDPYNDEAQNY
jgi:hypothetical protein|tara:strand:+ start:803 stop:2332 length:1530 start_codon:yes stop_codon:yes gene_type:complete